MHANHKLLTKQRNLMALALSLLWSTTVPAFSAVNFIGVATQIGSDNMLYKEVHCQARGKVLYLSPDNHVIANKTLSPEGEYEASTLKAINPDWVPQYKFVHQELAMGESLTYGKDQLILQRKEPGADEWETKALSLTGDKHYIADAGFDRYIRHHLSALINGNSLDITYVSAPRLSTINFTIKPIRQNEQQITLAFYPSNLVIRLLVDPIELVYGKDKARLLSFRGLTNLPKNARENHVAHIQYRYEEDLNEFCS